MSRRTSAPVPPLQIGALLRFALHEIRRRIYDGIVAAGFEDVRPSHVTLFRWPGPDGRRPSEVAADVVVSKQRMNDLLRELEDLGYLHLEIDSGDSRARVIRLSDRGKRLHKVALGIHTAIEDEWAKAVGAQRFRQLRQALAKIAQRGVRVDETANSE